jgi:hypothetical protein
VTDLAPWVRTPTTPVAPIDLTPTAAGDLLRNKLAAGDANPVFGIGYDGAQRWGPGGGNVPGILQYRFGFSQMRFEGCDLAINSVGGGLQIKEGANAKMGTAVLVAGTVTVNTTKAGAGTRIFLTTLTPGGTPGFLRVSAIVNGTSFTITSSSGTDTSTVSWLILDAL